MKKIHVAVGVILNECSEILLALRPEASHQGGLWEFPGGKVEPDESVQQALCRELKEELGIVAIGFRPLLEIHHDYGDKSVFLDVWWVDEFTGTTSGCEGQPVRWVASEELRNYAFPEANQPILEAIEQSLHKA